MGLAVIALLASRPVRIIAVDIVEAKLKMAGELGASCLVNSTYGDAESAMRDYTGGRGADAVIEASGSQSGLDLASRSLKENRGRFVCLSYPGKNISRMTSSKGIVLGK